MNVQRILPRRRHEISVAELAQRLGLRLEGGAGVSVTSVAEDNRDVVDGDLFVALPGERVHGARFADQAVSAGARAVLTDEAGLRLVRDQGVAVPVLVAGHPRSVAGAVASLVYRDPARRLTTFAVTGTNGKTTTTFLLDHLLRACGRRTGLIGTVESRFGDQVVPSRLTTPEAAQLQEWLAAMAEDGVDALSMEVSSHSIAMHRVDGVVFDVAGFTNLSQDHLDFHGDLESYFAAKARLFTPEHSRRAVVMVDDAWGERMARTASVPVTTVRSHDGEPGEGAGGAQPDWVVTGLDHGPGRTRFTLRHRDGRTIRTSTALPGGFNVANAALALVMAVESGVDAQVLSAALEERALDAVVPGRMETVHDSPRVVVDFAHNAEAMELALRALRPTTRGRLIIVFGATGDRDRGKRPVMGAVAATGADVVLVTDDDPHSEDPAPIRAQVLAGALAAADARGPGSARPLVREVWPRQRAIRDAVLEARADDTVLIAGRGHETVQEVDGVDLPLDDRVEARAAVRARGQARADDAPRDETGNGEHTG